jgi:hypothetical protein
MSDQKLLAKDLRIGNLVYAPLNELCVVDQIGRYDNPEYVAYHELNNLVSGGQNGQRPIPLSEDVLIKLGAEKKSTTEFRIGNRLLIYRKFSWWDYGADVELPYTHTLQNFIHSLTGEELIYTEN